MGKIIFKHNHVAKTKAVSVLVFLLIIAGCGTFGYSNSKYGAVVNCDADQPMDELLKCVDEKYAFMDKFHKSKFLEARERSGRFGKRTYEKPSDYQEIDQFVSIKQDSKYLRRNDEYPPRQLRVDDYKDTKMRVSQNFGLLSLYFEGSYKYVKYVTSGYGNFNKYTRSLKSISRDVLVTKLGAENKVYTASYELVPINNNEFLFVIAIGNFCQEHFDKKDVKPSMPGYVFVNERVMHKDDLNNYFEMCGVNYVYFTGKMEPELFIFDDPSEYPMAKNYWEKDLSDYTHEIITLSANKRENPTELYIKLNNRYFSLKLS